MKDWVQIFDDDLRLWPIATPTQGGSDGTNGKPSAWVYVHSDLAVARLPDGGYVFAVRKRSHTHRLIQHWRRHGNMTTERSDG